MQTLIEVILPVFLVMGFGYVAVWRGYFSETAVKGLNSFTHGFAIPCLLFSAISTLDLGQNFDPRLLGSFYTGALSGFVLGLLGGRFLFKREWEDAVAIGFCCLFSNTLMLGLPISERAYGADSLGPNYAIIAVHAPFCYLVGVTVMETVRNRGSGAGAALRSVSSSMARNPLVIGIGLGFIVNLFAIPLPVALTDAFDLMARAALPAALFGLGGVIYQYKPEGDLRTILYVSAVSLIAHPGIVWLMGRAVDLPEGAFRAAVLTAAMAPGINAYVFASLYGRALRVAASSVLLATAASVLTVWAWLNILG